MIFTFVIVFFVKLLLANDTLILNYHFINFEKNYIIYYNQNKLSSISRENKKIKILQIGDSHLVSGDFSKGLINTLQNQICVCNAKLDYEDYYKAKEKKKNHYSIIKKKIHNIVSIFSSTQDTCGIDYYCIASSGKTFKYFSQNKYLYQKIKEIKPNLIIISLGTNDLFWNFSENQLKNYIKILIKKLQLYNNLQIIFITPIEAIKKKGNNNINIVNKAIKNTVEEEKLALYDLYEVAGGKGARLKWLNNGLSRKDLIHFNRIGYYLQGVLLAKAIINSL